MALVPGGTGVAEIAIVRTRGPRQAFMVGIKAHIAPRFEPERRSGGVPRRASAVRPEPPQFIVSAVELSEDGLVRKGPTYTGGFVGGFIGSFIPSLWGAGQLSISSVLFFMIGGFFGIWVAYRLFV